MSSPTILIGLSGASFPALDALLEDGGLPFLKEWSSSAVRAELGFSSPLSEAAAWTSLITGRSPGAHGIFDLFRKQSPNGHQFRALNARDPSSETLWSHLNREGLRVTVFEYPLTVPAPRIEGHIAPGSWASARQLKMGCNPSDLSKRLEDAGVMRMESLAMEWPGADNHANWIQGQIEREENLFRALRYLRDAEPSDLTAALIRGFGAAQNLYLQNSDIRGKCLEYFHAFDRRLEEFSRGGTLLLVSETSSANSPGFPVNDWLAARGYFAWENGQAPPPLEKKVLDTDQANRQAKWIDWSRTKAFAPQSNESQIYIVPSDDGSDAFRERLVEEFGAEPGISRVWKREELFAGPYSDLAPDLILETAGNSPGIFLASGSSLKQGIRMAKLSLLDVAPLLLYHFNLAIPSEMEGRVPVEAIDDNWLARAPVRLASKPAEPVVEERVLDPEAEMIVLKRLQDLGYLE